MKTFTTAFSLKVLMAVAALLFILGIAMIDSAGAGEKVKASATGVRTKWHPIEVNDEEGHIIAVYENTNVYFSDRSDEMPTGLSRGIVDMCFKMVDGLIVY